MPRVEYLDYEVVENRGWSLDSDDLFEKASDADLADDDFGSFEVSENTSILEGAEATGQEWPFLCRSGTCANCSAFLYEGEVDMDRQRILTDEETEKMDVRLTCISEPATDTVKIIYNAKEHEHLQRITT